MKRATLSVVSRRAELRVAKACAVLPAAAASGFAHVGVLDDALLGCAMGRRGPPPATA